MKKRTLSAVERNIYLPDYYIMQKMLSSKSLMTMRVKLFRGLCIMLANVKNVFEYSAYLSTEFFALMVYY